MAIGVPSQLKTEIEQASACKIVVDAPDNDEHTQAGSVFEERQGPNFEE